MTRMIDADALDVVTAKVPKGMDAKSYMAGMEYVLGQVDAMPVIEERKGKWIPCSERLPEVDVDVLVSYHAYGDSESEYFPPYDGVMITCLTEVTNNGIPDFYDMTDDVQPTAWMPLPEPWKGDAKCTNAR